MKPLSVRLYIKRNIKRVLIIIISLMVAVFANYFFFLSTETTLEAINNQESIPCEKVTKIEAKGNNEIPDKLINKLKDDENTDVLIPYKGRVGSIRFKRGLSSSGFNILDVFREDIKDVMKLYDINIVEGNIPKEDENGVIINEKLAKQYNLKVGSTMISDDKNISIGYDLKVTGIYKGDIMVAISSSSKEMEEGQNRDDFYKYAMLYKSKDESYKSLSERESYTNVYISDLSTCENEIDKSLFALKIFNKSLSIFMILILCLALGNLSYINYQKRNTEMFILNAIGYEKKTLLFKLLKENTVACFIGYTLGILITMIIVGIMNVVVFSSKGSEFLYFNLSGILNTLIIPVFVSIFSVLPCMLSKFNNKNFS